MQQCIFFSPESSRSVSKSSLQGDGTSYMYVTSVCGSSREAQLLSDASSVSMLFILLTAMLSLNFYTYFKKVNFVLLCDIKNIRQTIVSYSCIKLHVRYLKNPFYEDNFVSVFFKWEFKSDLPFTWCINQSTELLNQFNSRYVVDIIYDGTVKYVLSFLYRNSNKIFKSKEKILFMVLQLTKTLFI